MVDDNDEIDAGEGAEPIVDPDNLKSSRGWLALITSAERAFRDWQDRADNVDRAYANLERLASISREREFQLFWANVQVLGPSVYSRPPSPVVVPRFKDQRKLPRTASELLERCTVVTFETQDIDGTMRLVRDDLNVPARGAIWCRYEAEAKNDDLGQRACVEHVDRRDFSHDPVRKWADVDWVSKRSWLTRKEARKRFAKTSGNAYQQAAYERRKDSVTGETETTLKAGFWELWSKSQNKVVWVSENVDVVLDSDKPHLTLEGFFPCPKPAFGTTQRGTLIPVPDMLFYKDQIEEINEFTARISALAEGLRLKGFYPAGAGEIADAVEGAIKKNDNNAVLIPVSNWAMMGGSSAKDLIVWLPLDMVASTIMQLIELRKQLIEDVYQIMGLSDIMRGQTQASETLGAQQLKSQYGSVRIRDKQDELVRIARDVTRIVAEIMAENFSAKSLNDMSQMSLPTDAEIAKQIRELEAQFKAQVKEAQADPQLMRQAQQDPEKAKQVIQQAQQQMMQQATELKETVTIDQVVKFLRDNRIRAFTLDIETDSTISPDENAQKQRAAEFTTAVGGYLGQALPLVAQVPEASELVAETLKYIASQYRAGRQLDGVIDDFADKMKQRASQPQGPSPEQMQMQADQQAEQSRQQMDSAKMQAEGQKAQADAQLASKQLELDAFKAKSEQESADKDRELERYKADLQAATSIHTAEISAQQANDAQALEAHLEQQVGVSDQRHELTTMAADQQHEREVQAQDQQHQQAMQQAEQAHQAEQQQSAQVASQQQAETAAAAKPQGPV